MARSKSIAARRHRKVKKSVKGYKHAARKRVNVAKQAILHAGQYAYIGRKLRKRDMRRLWITRLNAAVRQEGLTYSKFIKILKQNNVEIDRKVLSDIAVRNPDAFKSIIAKLK
jgi:large subunit ribosomal protein L20